MLTLVACGNEAGVTTNSPVNSSVTTSVTGIVTNVAAETTSLASMQAVGPIQTQGLGISKVEWEKVHGLGIPIVQGLPSFQYEQNQYQVIMANDLVAQVERRWLSQAVSLDMAKAESKKLYPADAKFIKSIVTATDKDNVDVFFSNMAKQAFASIPVSTPLWPGGSPGNFTVTYRQDANHQITSIIIALGINPT